MNLPDLSQYFFINGTRNITAYDLYFPYIERLKLANNTGYLHIIGGDTTNTGGASITLNGKDYPSVGGFINFRVPDAAKTSYKTAISITGDTNTPDLRLDDTYIIRKNSKTSGIYLAGGDGIAGEGSYVIVYGNAHANAGQIRFAVPNAAKDAVTTAAYFTGATDTPTLDMESHKIVDLGTPSASTDAATKGYVDGLRKAGAAASKTDGSTITHGFGSTPTGCLITLSVANEIGAVTAISSTTLTLAIKKRADGSAGTSQTVYWECY